MERMKTMATYSPPIIGNLHSDYHIEFAKMREEKGELATLERIYLPKMMAGGLDFEFFTVGGDHRHFTRHDDLTNGTLRMIDHLWAETDESPHFVIARSSRDILKAKDEGKRALILALEGAAPVKEDLALVRSFYRLGLRSICLTWFKANPSADGINEKRSAGLSNFGRDLIAQMNDLGMIIDVSQSSDTTFDDVISLSKDPVVASHSGVRGIHDHSRNLSDDQLRRLAEKGGVLGIITFPRHLGSGNPDIEAYFLHIDHAVKVAGEDSVALGLNIIPHDPEIIMNFFSSANIDYDVIRLPGLEDVDQIPAVVQGLVDRGYKTKTIDKIMGENLLLVVSNVIDR